MEQNQTLTTLTGVKVGHATYPDKLTGCTVVLFDKPLPTVYKGYGGDIGSFNTEGLQGNTAYIKRQALFIAGGSYNGFMTGTAVMQAMIDDQFGDKDDAIINPGVSGAIVYDLGTRVTEFRSEYGTEAYKNATSDPVASGNVGAGTGTAVGKFQWLEQGTKSGGMKAGVGNARVDVGNGVIVTALSVVNALGNIVLPDGTILAGNREVGKKFKTYEDLTEFVTQDSGNTTVTIVGINVDLGSQGNYEKVAHLATHGHVRAIHPVNLSQDGDSLFLFSTQEIKKPLNHFAKFFSNSEDGMDFVTDIIGNAAAKAVQESIYDACRSAETIEWELGYNGVIPSTKDY